MKRFQLVIITCFSIGLSGCYSIGHNAFIENKNSEVGKKTPYKFPFEFEDSGELFRGDFAIAGKGLTHITKDKEGNLIYHFDEEEILPNFHIKEWVGKCMTYIVVDPRSYIVKDWGFDKGGNPLSCRVWP